MRIRRHLTYANVAATLALVLAMSGSAYALIVTSADIKNGTIKSIDVGNDKLTGTDLKNRSVGTADLGLNVNSAGVSKTSVSSPETQANELASVTMTLKKPGDVLGVLTLQTDGVAAPSTTLTLTPYVDGVQHGSHTYVVPAEGSLETVTILCNAIPAGSHTFSIWSDNPNDNVTIANLEWSTIALP